MADDGYNGWSNYGTWVTALWLDNDETTYHETRALVREILAEGMDDCPFKDEDLRASWMVGNVANALRDETHNVMPDLGGSLWADLLGSAFGEIDWHEIARNYIYDASLADQ